MTKADRTVPVSVLLPVHNGGRHLEAAVTSILTQTHDDLELLVIDDGSTDGSGEWLDALTDARVRVLHQPNRGLVATLNRGLAQARHDLVARMDADDVSEPRRLELQVRHLLDHPEVAAVGCCYRVVDEQDRLVQEAHTAADPAYQHRRLYFRNVLPHAGMTFRRDVVRAAGGYREVGPVEDYDLWVRLAAAHAVASLPQPLLRYRASPAGISMRDNDRQRRCLREARDRLHEERPMVPVPAGQVLREGLAHTRTYGATCPSAARDYVFDHVWLAVLLARRRRVRLAAALLVGALGVVARRPSAGRALMDVVRRR
jgi:glycosyltransferase involved in cell wall biosynthesis